MAHTEDPVLSSAAGLLRCLKLLAEEAGDLRLHQTLRAIQDAVRIASQELDGDHPAPLSRPTHRSLH